jgi:hypothetical protein
MTKWAKSSYSGDSANCVEWRHGAAAVDVRDSKDPAGPHLTVSPDSWRAFIDAIKAGEIA